MCQATRGNKKWVQTAVTTAESPKLLALRLALAVPLVDVFSNYASATFKVKS